MTADLTTHSGKKWMALTGGVFLLAAATWLYYTSKSEEELKDIPTYEVKRGEFLITLVESGEIRAAEAERIVAPDVRGRLQVAYLWPEGEYVDVGDLVLEFNKTNFVQNLLNTGGELEKVQSDFARAKAEMDQKLIELNIQIEQKKAQLELEKINLKRGELGTPIELEEARIKLKQAERLLSEAKGRLKADQIATRVDLQNQQLNIARWQKRYDRRLRDYKRLSVYSTRPGLVVYEKVRKPEGLRKVRVGDRVWDGLTLISLPDLSKLQTILQIGEGDVEKVEPGQKVFVRLDAYPGPVFTGQVAKIFPMANPHEDAPNVQVFEMIINIEEQDPRLKPGMSAAAEIILEVIPDVLSIPLESVVQQEDKSLVYCLRGHRFEALEVGLGKRNATSIIIESGLEEGDLIALKDPALL
jgi:HlyD family secretion protein